MSGTFGCGVAILLISIFIYLKSPPIGVILRVDPVLRVKGGQSWFFANNSTSSINLSQKCLKQKLFFVKFLTTFVFSIFLCISIQNEIKYLH